MTNHKTEAIAIEVVRRLPYRANLTFADPTPDRDGSTLTWRLEINPSETKTIRYGYEELLDQKS